jgi:hypothetical protein
MKWKNWKEFKQAVEAEGITDETEIHWIDANCYEEIDIWWPAKDMNNSVNISSK